MQAQYCALGCERFLNFTRGCPGVEWTLSPDAYSVAISGDCVEQCGLSNFPAGGWWHYTKFNEYFACLDRHAYSCDFWQVYRECSPMLEEMMYAFEILSFFCCLAVLCQLCKELSKGMLPQALFLCVIHNALQALLTEEGCNVWAKYILPKGVPSVVGTVVVRYVHIWLMVGGLIWSIVAAVVVLRITQRSKPCMVCAKYMTKHKAKFIALLELFLLAMCLLTILARFLIWRRFFYGLTIFAIVLSCLTVLCYAIPAIRARHMQRVAKAHQIQKDASQSSGERKFMLASNTLHTPRARPPTRVQVKPFLLLLGVVTFTYVPFVITYLIPAVKRTRSSYLTGWAFIELAGVWHFTAMMIIKWNIKAQKKKTVIKVYLRQDRLVGRRNLIITACHSFFRSPIDPFWYIATDPTLYGLSASEPEEENIVAGDFEQSSQGELIRWTKRPSRHAYASVRAAGLPLDKFELFVDVQVVDLFPLGCLRQVHAGYCMAMNLSKEDVEQKLQLEAIAKYEEASLLWKDAAVHWKPVSEERRTGSLPPEESLDRFENAQLCWAYEETLLKLKTTIAVLLRWKRLGGEVTNKDS